MRSQVSASSSDRPGAARAVVLACAASAGAHAGLVPEHLRSEPRLGAAFVVAVALLVAVGAAAVLRPGDRRLGYAAAILFGGLILAYAASRTTGIPVLDPEAEALDAVGVGTVLVEGLGLAFALALVQPPGPPSRRSIVQEVSR
jgi:hypothetical protein